MLGSLIVGIADFYVVLILIYVLMSWIPSRTGVVGSVYSALASLCEPYLGIFRRMIPPAGGIDFSPVIAVVVLQLLVRLIIYLL